MGMGNGRSYSQKGYVRYISLSDRSANDQFLIETARGEIREPQTRYSLVGRNAVEI